ncbi:hypothetical protein [Agromyces marinus]|uniref:Uncharacterized protein n=2 Tax=Agromyces marinus TaxID=1389020 RepID=A0ABN6YHH5_9MICO|nr:hypothetical protein [Agromyces marinus]BDZ55411.1 hypothetical protein GCM10025870_24840 [Agromyces marinus]
MPRRNLLQGWCAEGVTLTGALEGVPASSHQARESEFASAGADESRAALYLHLFTGSLPQLEDTAGRQSAVDLTLHSNYGLVGIAEVTSTLDRHFQRDSGQLRRLVASVNAEYAGTGAWSLGFEYGWSMPTNTQLPGLAQRLSAELERADASTNDDEAVTLAEHVLAYRVEQGLGPRVHLASWSANVPTSADTPYLDRLSTYLAESDLIARKLAKLAAEGERLGTNSLHLYLLMASTGVDGGLLPSSPSFFTWGRFACPAPATDLWLDGGTGEIYHWSQDTGWVFHRV